MVKRSLTGTEKDYLYEAVRGINYLSREGLSPMANAAMQNGFLGAVTQTLDRIRFDDESSRMQFEIPREKNVNPYRSGGITMELLRLGRTEMTYNPPRWRRAFKTASIERELASGKPIHPETLGRLAREGTYGSVVLARKAWEEDDALLTKILEASLAEGFEWYLVGTKKTEMPGGIETKPILWISGVYPLIGSSDQNGTPIDVQGRLKDFSDKYTRVRRNWLSRLGLLRPKSD